MCRQTQRVGLDRERGNCFPRLPFHLEVLLQLKFNSPKGNASLSFPAQSFLPLWLYSFYKCISTLPITKTPTAGVQTKLLPQTSPFPAPLGAAASYRCVPFVCPYSSSLWHQCPVILTISYASYCKNLPAVSLAFCSSLPQLCYIIAFTLPTCFFDCFSLRLRDLFDWTPCTSLSVFNSKLSL